MSGCRLEDAIRAMIEVMPHGSSVTLPVDWLRSQLGMASVSLAPQPAPADDPVKDMSVDDVAKLVGRKPSTVRGWCASGQLEGYRLNNREWCVTPAALEEFRSRQREAQIPASTVAPRTAPPRLDSWRSAKNVA